MFCVTLLASASMLLASCGSPSEPPFEIPPYTVDSLIKDFLSDTDLVTPELHDIIGDNYEFLYYREYRCFYISGEVEDSNNVLAREYNSKMDEDTNWEVYNNASFPVEDYGYMYVDDISEANVELDFDSDDGIFSFTIYRWDKKYGKADVSKVDTSWYVDYVNFYGLEVSTTCPSEEIKDFLGADIEVPLIEGPSTFVLWPDENDSTYSLIIEGHNYSPFESSIRYNPNWQTFEYTYESYDPITDSYLTETAWYGYDVTHNLYIDTYAIGEDTIMVFSLFEDIFTDERTSNTDWEDYEKDLMNDYLGQVMPFMAFGDNYMVSLNQYADRPNITIHDTYFENLTGEYENILYNNGFESKWSEDSVHIYTYDNHTYYLEVRFNYDKGNTITIYYEPTRYVAATAISLVKNEVYLVPGCHFTLSYTLTPSNAQSDVEYLFSSEYAYLADSNTGEIATSELAPIGTNITVTVTTSEGISANCVFHISDPNIILGVEFEFGDTLELSQGETWQFTYNSIIPYGIAYSGDIVLGTDNPTALAAAGITLGLTQEGYNCINVGNSAPVGSTYPMYAMFDDLKVSFTLLIVLPPVTHTLTDASFEMSGDAPAKNYYYSYDNGDYEAFASSNTGMHFTSEEGNSGIIGKRLDSRVKSITITFNSNTAEGAFLDLYVYTSSFAISDMYDAKSANPIYYGSIAYDELNPTRTFEIRGHYDYFGLRSSDGDIYLNSIEVTWQAYPH